MNKDKGLKFLYASGMVSGIGRSLALLGAVVVMYGAIFIYERTGNESMAVWANVGAVLVAVGFLSAFVGLVLSMSAALKVGKVLKLAATVWGIEIIYTIIEWIVSAYIENSLVVTFIFPSIEVILYATAMFFAIKALTNEGENSRKTIVNVLLFMGLSVALWVFKAFFDDSETVSLIVYPLRWLCESAGYFFYLRFLSGKKKKDEE